MAPTTTATISLTELPTPHEDSSSQTPSAEPAGFASLQSVDDAAMVPAREFVVDQFHGLTRTKKASILGLIMSVNLVQVRPLMTANPLPAVCLGHESTAWGIWKPFQTADTNSTRP
jgi:hypothetical protein